jgi:hypothetical protein
MSSAKAFQTIIPNGKPNGLKEITVPGWSGRCYVVPRQSIGELKDLDNNNKPGIYILFGQEEISGDKLAYIGESESFFGRITSHHATKDFWDTAVIFTGSLNRAYVKYLEHRATLLASKAGRMKMQNSIQPQENTLSEFDKVAVEQFFEYMQFILSALNYEIFEKVEHSVAHSAIYYLKSKDYDAQAKLLDNGNVLVLSGSQAAVNESNSFGGWPQAARQTFLENGTLVANGDSTYIFTKDVLFRKPSPAAAVVTARSINGWTAWKDKRGNTLDQNIR